MLASGSLALHPLPAIAESGSKPVLEEIIVTARMREETLQDVPLAISAFTADDILSRNLSSLNKIADQTPGMNFQTTGSLTANRVTIRGMSQLTRGVDETNVASFIDGIYTPGFSGTEISGFETLERIEVVKGPQSALYGRNSFAGAINYITKKPTYDLEYGGRATLGTGNQQGLYAYLSGPLVADTLAARVDGSVSESGGTHKNSANGETLGNAERKYVRGSIRWDVTDNFNATLSLSAGKDDVSTSAMTQITDDDPRRIGIKPYDLNSIGPYQLGAGYGQSIGILYSGELTEQSDTFNFDPRSNAGVRDTRRAGLVLEWNFDDFQLISRTGYQTRTLDAMSDLNTCRPESRSAACNSIDPNQFGTYYSGVFAFPANGNLLIGGPMIVNTLLGTHEDRKEFSQDLRIQSIADSPFTWSAGLYYSNEDFTDQTSRTADRDVVSGLGTVYALDGGPFLNTNNEINNKFYSIYGSAAFDFLNSWNFSTELRATREEKQTNQTENNFPSTATATGLQSRNFDYLTPRFILSYMPAKPVMFYMSASKGVKSGGFNPGAPEGVESFDPEQNWTYEFGTKYTFWDQRAQMNLAAYFIDWTDQQFVSTLDGTNPLVTNIAKTEIKGLELDGVFNLTDWLSFNFGYAFVDPKYTEGTLVTLEGLIDCEIVGIPCDAPDGSSTGDISGKQVIGTSKHSIVTGLGFDVPVGRQDWAFISRIDYSYKSKQYIDEANAGYTPDRGILNLRAGLRNNNWTLEGYCNNATDDSTPLYALPPRDIFGVPHYYAVNRNGRMCGMQFGYNN